MRFLGGQFETPNIYFFDDTLSTPKWSKIKSRRVERKRLILFEKLLQFRAVGDRCPVFCDRL